MMAFLPPTLYFGLLKLEMQHCTCLSMVAYNSGYTWLH
jgi:hypothetical protein